MTDLLNLDELLEIEREVTIRGVNYPIVERSVGVMLDSLKIAKRQGSSRGGKKVSEEEFFQDMLKTLKTIIPDAPDEVLRGLTMRQMVAVLEFCNQNPEDLAEKVMKEGEKVEGGKTQEVALSGEA